MKIMKQFVKGAIAGASLLALVGTASAAEVNINLYGASAQHLFWNDAADNFLASKGCTGVAQDEYNSKHGITKGTCGADTVYIRYSSKASFDGIYAMKGTANTDSCPTVGSVPGAKFRKMVNETSCSDWALGGTACGSLKCVDVTLGASDVAGQSFTQTSTGQKYGPAGGAVITQTFSGISTDGLTPHQPLVVPFGFFANNSVTKTKCLGPDPLEPTSTAHKAISKWGYQCYDPEETGHSEDCIGYYKCVSGTCSGGVNVGDACTRANQCPDVDLEDTHCERIPLDNITRLMATQIFSGQAWNWKDFGDWYPNLPIVACLRHAGSGTHATLDYAVMRASSSDWGWPLIQTESAGGPTAWFNDGSGDEMNCINTLEGAIGYADADQLAGSSNYPNVHALRYGVEPTREKIRNGEYDFYSNQWLFEDPQEPNYVKTHPIVVNLIAFASNPANIPSSKADYWAAKDEMWFNKSTDQEYPGFVGAGDPQLP